LANRSACAASGLSFFSFSFKNYFMKNANEQFQDFTGTTEWYMHFTGLLYTDGIKALVENFQCYWLVDLVASYQHHQAVKGESFQTWQLTRVKADSFKATCTDGNDRKLVDQFIPFSDFDADVVKLYLANGVLLLPSEY